MDKKLHANILIDEQVFKYFDKKNIDTIKSLLKSEIDKLVKNNKQGLKDFHIDVNIVLDADLQHLLNK